MHPWHVFRMEGYLLTYYTLMSSVKERKGKQKENTLLKNWKGRYVRGTESCAVVMGIQS